MNLASASVITKIAGNGTLGFSGNGSPPTAAELSDPTFALPTGPGDFLIVDAGNNVVRSVSAGSGGEGQQVSVSPAPLVITAVSETMAAGGPVPALAASYSGFENGDTAASLSLPPTLSTPATGASPAGSYPITAGGASAAHYSITYVPGTLTIISAPPPAVVEKVLIEKQKTGKHKTTKVIVLEFNEALTAADAQSLGSYTLATVPKSKKQKSKPVALSKASYSAAAFTVTLWTRKPLVLSPPLKLTVEAASLLDIVGRPLDGGTNYTTIVK